MAQARKAKTKASDRSRATIRELRQRIKQLEFERDGYLQTVKALLPNKRFRFTRKELREMEAFRPTFGEFVQQLKTELNASE